jgi:hypothetical protein
MSSRTYSFLRLRKHPVETERSQSKNFGTDEIYATSISLSEERSEIFTQFFSIRTEARRQFRHR